MALSDFLGNTSVVESFKRQLSENRLAGSLLFVGISGVGKWTLAHFISKAINCQRRLNDFCDECRSCLKISQQVHPDVRNYAPDGPFIKINQMREMSREIFFKPFEGRRRVFIIDNAHRLRLEAANAILRPLEEPPESSLLILVTDSPNDLLATIRSRCQQTHFAPFSEAALESILRQRSDCSTQDLPLVGRISRGSLGKALSLDIIQYRQARQDLLAAMQACAGKFSYHEASQITESLISAKQKDLFNFKVDVLYNLLRDLFLLTVDPTTKGITNTDLHEELLSLSSSLGVKQVVGATRSLDHLMRGERRNLNKTLAVDRFLFKLSGSVNLQPI